MIEGQIAGFQCMTDCGPSMIAQMLWLIPAVPILSLIHIYPEERIAPIEATRDFPFLVYDQENRDGGGPEWEAGMRCVACQICEKECPPKCIYIEKSKDKKLDYLGKAQYYPARFDIDISVCMSCQICVEVCPFEAIKMRCV